MPRRTLYYHAHCNIKKTILYESLSNYACTPAFSVLSDFSIKEKSSCRTVGNMYTKKFDMKRIVQIISNSDQR